MHGCSSGEERGGGFRASVKWQHPPLPLPSTPRPTTRPNGRPLPWPMCAASAIQRPVGVPYARAAPACSLGDRVCHGTTATATPPPPPRTHTHAQPPPASPPPPPCATVTCKRCPVAPAAASAAHPTPSTRASRSPPPPSPSTPRHSLALQPSAQLQHAQSSPRLAASLTP
jgi:hypothetical protein